MVILYLFPKFKSPVLSMTVSSFPTNYLSLTQLFRIHLYSQNRPTATQGIFVM